jgi:ribonuclease P protein component
MSTSNRHTFPKAEKLKSRKQIDLLFREGKSFFAAPVKCYYRLTGLQVDGLTSLQVDRLEGETVNTPHHLMHEKPTLNPKTPNPNLQISNLKGGFTASKKNFKKAAERNRIKRLLREAYRIHKAPLLEKAAERQLQLEVFFVFTDKTMPSFALIEEKMKYCIRRLGKIVEGGV